MIQNVTHSLNPICQTVIHFKRSSTTPIHFESEKKKFPLRFPTRQSIARGSRSSCRGKGLSESIKKIRFVRTWAMEIYVTWQRLVPEWYKWCPYPNGNPTNIWIKSGHVFDNSKRGTLMTSSSAWMRLSQQWMDETCIKTYEVESTIWSKRYACCSGCKDRM